MGRGVAWTSKDDVLLCEAWLDASQDPHAATDQKMATFWDKIMKYIKRNKGTIRSVRSSQSRFQHLSAAVQKFAGVYTQQEIGAASGTNDVDMERAAMEVYRAESTGGKSFQYRECWLKLKDYPKWPSKAKGSQLDQENPEDANPGSTSVTDPPPHTPGTTNSETNVVRGRPIGVKKAKMLNRESTDLKRQLEAVASSNLLAAKRARILQQQVALGYFRMSTNDMPIELRDRFERTRDQLLNELDATPLQNAQASEAAPQSRVNHYAASPASVAAGLEAEGAYTTFEDQDPQNQNEDYVQGNHNEDDSEDYVQGNHNEDYVPGNQTDYYAGYVEVDEGLAAGSPDMQQTRSHHQPSRYAHMDDFDLRIGM